MKQAERAAAGIEDSEQRQFLIDEAAVARTFLAMLLLKRALESKDDLSWQYMLLCEARDQAIESGDVDLLQQAMAALAERFAIDAERFQLLMRPHQ